MKAPATPCRLPAAATGKLPEVAARLEARYGRTVWPADGDPLWELLGTILSQHTSDVNSGRAFRALRDRYPTPELLLAAPVDEVAETIRSGGLANIKAERIQKVLRNLLDVRGSLALDDLGGMSVDGARAILTALPGVGPKTASCVLLFSVGLPAFPVDTHVHRVVGRIGLIGPKMSADAAHGAIEAQLPGDRDSAIAFHLALIQHGKQVCKAIRPRCDECPLTDCCDYWKVTHG